MTNEEYYYKTIELTHYRKTLKFMVSQSLFSSFQIDIGTMFLLRSISNLELDEKCRILDVGCGYGPVGLILKSLYPSSIVHMVDKDALAVDYSRQNAELNNMNDVRVYGSLDYGNVKETDFDLVISNIPAKAGDAVITHLIKDAGNYLNPKGTASVVVVNSLETLVDNIFKNEPGIVIVNKLNRPGHVVYQYRYIGGQGSGFVQYPDAFERGIYKRNDMTVRFGDITYSMSMASGLQEFDKLHYCTEILLEVLHLNKAVPVKSILVFNPGQGHVPVYVWKLLHPEKMIIVDRDLLSIKNTKRNLMINECPERCIRGLHQVVLQVPDEEKIDLIAGVLRDDEGDKAHISKIRQTAEQLSDTGTIVVSATSTIITRLEKTIKAERLLRVMMRKKWKGFSALVVKKTIRD